MRLFIFTLLAFSIHSPSLMAMGGDKPGPNGGYITMPGTYHVELIDKGEAIRIYLLDIAIKNPTVENSNVSVRFINHDITKVQCASYKNYFVCEKPNKDLNTYKKIEVESERKKVIGKTASYSIPLRFH
ncbi:MAG: hypothetical protein KBD76_02575 [Bacteriovorax sp.]|jgi:hypothetical protein|nr:hypothetical protein [Bacteriovorax sp.]